MVKSILKETFIMLLLCIAIVLILGVLFYDYIPSNKVIPNKVAYTTPENVEQEINETITQINKTEVSYEITDADLNLYKQSHSYNPGKPDPFSVQEENTQTNTNTSTPGTNTNTGNSTGANTNTNSDSTGTFFNNTGLK